MDIESLSHFTYCKTINSFVAAFVKLLVHILTFLVTAGFYMCCARLAGAASHDQKVFRAVLPYRLTGWLLTPFFLLASWNEWGKQLGPIFLLIAIGCIPLGACVVSLRVTLDSEGIQREYMFRRGRIRFEDITEARFRSWTSEYVLRGRDGTKIVFPTWLEGAQSIFERCSRRPR